MKKLFLLFTISIFCQNLFAQGIRNIGANIVIEAGANIYIDGNANGKYTNESTGANHGEIDLNGNIYIEGDWINNATSGNVFVNNTSSPWGTVIFDGSLPQRIAGSRATHFESIQLNNSTTVLDVDSIEINFKTTLISGDLDLNSKMLILNNSNAPDLMANIGFGIISETTTAPFGAVKWNIGSNTGMDYLIPFIDSNGGSEIPLIFTPTSGTTGSLKVATYHTPTNNSPLPPTVNHLRDNTGNDISALVADRFWMIEVADTTITADILVTATNAEIAAVTDPIIQSWHKSEDGWKVPSGFQVNVDTRTIYASGITNFNTWWGAAPAANPLPIELLNFSAECETNSVHVSWVTASEINNDFFTIEKTMDRINFETIAIIPGAGNSNNTLHYSLVDNSSLSKTTYYRLTQTDYNGQSETFKPVSVNPCAQQTSWSMQAIQGQNSTVRITFQSSVNDLVLFEIFDVLGNKIAENNIELFGGYQAEQLEVSNLIPGIYIGTAKTNNAMQTLKFMVKN